MGPISPGSTIAITASSRRASVYRSIDTSIDLSIDLYVYRSNYLCDYKVRRISTCIPIVVSVLFYCISVGVQINSKNNADIAINDTRLSTILVWMPIIRFKHIIIRICLSIFLLSLIFMLVMTYIMIISRFLRLIRDLLWFLIQWYWCWSCCWY